MRFKLLTLIALFLFIGCGPEQSGSEKETTKKSQTTTRYFLKCWDHTGKEIFNKDSSHSISCSGGYCSGMDEDYNSFQVYNASCVMEEKYVR